MGKVEVKYIRLKVTMEQNVTWLGRPKMQWTEKKMFTCDISPKKSVQIKKLRGGRTICPP
jgi:hypothetical protein